MSKRAVSQAAHACAFCGWSPGKPGPDPDRRLLQLAGEWICSLCRTPADRRWEMRHDHEH